MAPLRELYAWTDRLTGIDSDRAQTAAAAASRWPVPALARRLGRPRDIDDVVRVVLLSEGIDALADRGVPRNKMLAKLKDVRQFEATWAELYVASVLAANSDDDVRVELEAGASQGVHADVRLIVPDEAANSFEIKAVGLSDCELAFCQRMAPSLDLMIPKQGIVTGHAPLDGKPPQLTAGLVQTQAREAMRLAAAVPQYPPGLSAAVIVAREAEDGYARRAAERVVQAVRQLPARDEGWVALLWTNGAPVDHGVSAPQPRRFHPDRRP